MSQLPLLNVLRTEPMPPGWKPDALERVDSNEVAVDFETTGLRWWEDDRPCGVAVAWRRGGNGPLVERYYPFAHAGGNLDEERVKEWFRNELRGKTVLNLNTKFDVHHSRVWGVDLREIAGRLGDVGHYAALLDDHRRRFNLETLAQDYLSEGKTQGLDLSNGAHVYPGWQVTSYGRQDAGLVIRIMDVQRPRLIAEDLLQVAALEDRVIPATVEMEANGCPIDMLKLEAWERETRATLSQMLMALAQGAGHSVNPKSGVDMERLFAERGWESDEKTEGGAPSFSDRVMAKFGAKDHVIKLAREAAHMSDLRSKYLCSYMSAVGLDGVMRYGLHQLRSDEGGTVSGRYASSALTSAPRSGVNVQQVMAVSKQKRLHGDKYIIRELYVPAPGRLLLAADAKQIEFRILVEFTKSERLLKQYADNPDTDFHAMVADMVQKIRPDFDRKRVKNMNFEQAFGGGLAKTAEMLGVSEKEARGFIRTYDKGFPELRKLMKLAMDTAERRGYVRTPLGRRTRFPDRKRLHKALNGAVQGDAADVNKQKIAELYEHRRELGITLRMTVHDEAVMDADSSAGVSALLDKQTSLTPRRVPILWDAKTGKNWAECA